MRNFVCRCHLETLDGNITLDSPCEDHQTCGPAGRGSTFKVLSV